jgi:hypothetical protein
LLCCQDAILPFASDSRWSDDTVFWVFESDFRFWKPGDEPAAVKDRLERQFSMDELYLDSDRKKPDEPTAVDPMKKVYCREIGDSWFIRCKGSTDVLGGGVLDFVLDIMMMLSLASRVDCGDFFWWSWIPHAKLRRSMPCHGAMFLSLVAPAARKILSAMADNSFGKPYHWDLVLRDWLQSNQAYIKSGHLWPSMGSFVTHRSACEAMYDIALGRPSEFHGNYNAPGTRTSEDSSKRDKWIARFQAKGGAEWKLKIRLPENRCDPIYWYSFAKTLCESTAIEVWRDPLLACDNKGVWDDAEPLFDEPPWATFPPRTTSSSHHAASSSSTPYQSLPPGKGSKKGKSKPSAHQMRRQRTLDFCQNLRRWVDTEEQAHLAMVCWSGTGAIIVFCFFPFRFDHKSLSVSETKRGPKAAILLRPLSVSIEPSATIHLQCHGHKAVSALTTNPSAVGLPPLSIRSELTATMRSKFPL